MSVKIKLHTWIYMLREERLQTNEKNIYPMNHTLVLFLKLFWKSESFPSGIGLVVNNPSIQHMKCHIKAKWLNYVTGQIIYKNKNEILYNLLSS